MAAKDSRALEGASKHVAALALTTLFISAAPAAGVLAAAPTTAASMRLSKLAASVDKEALSSDLRRLVGFGTRHTLSDTTSSTRGIGAARAFAKARFKTLAAACGGCLTVATPRRDFTGARIPGSVAIEDVLAVQAGVADPNRVIIISAHIDSRVSDPMNAVSDAPGANDDASGVAAVLEAARILSKEKLNATVVYAVLSGEEQGLFGGKLLAETAAAKGWSVEAVLNNDIIGNTHGADGLVAAHTVRVFSEGVRSGETALEAADRRRSGGEADAPSRALARAVASICASAVKDLRVRLVFRADRFGRGGDQGPMQDAGFPAVRITEADENYTRQHQDVRSQNGVDYGDVLSGVDISYLARVTGMNVAALAGLASAPPPPTGLKITGAVSPDTTLAWAPALGAADYQVSWRETTAPLWEAFRGTGGSTTATLKGVNIDDYNFGVAAVSKDGYVSPFEFPGAVGAFVREDAPPPAASPAPAQKPAQ